MNKIHKQRLYYLGLLATGLAIATSLILYALKQNINLFLTPDQIISQHISADDYIRLGGMVRKGSVARDKEGLGVRFIVTDLKRDIAVYYQGILPDLFREGKGVVAEGHMNDTGIFIASQVLAKHDENYIPKNIDKKMREKNTA